MAGLSQNITPFLIDHLTSKNPYTMPTAYLALLTGAGATGSSTLATMNEVTTVAYPSYSRVAVPGSSLNSAGHASPGITENSLAITFPVCGAGGTAPVITSWALVDHASLTTGNILWTGTFSSPMTVNGGNQPSVAAANITLTMTTAGGFSYFAVDKLIDHSDGKNAYALATPLWIALVTGTPAASQVAAATDIVEPTSGQYTGYLRVQIPSAHWHSAAIVAGAGQTTNSFTVTFPQSTGGTGATITGFAVIDGGSATPGSAGNILFWSAITAQIISPNTTPFFDINGLTLSLS